MLTVSYLQQTIEAIEVTPFPKKTDGDVLIDTVDFDARRLHGRSLFVALTTGKVDGHTYIPQAIANGAVAILCSDVTAIPTHLTKGITFFVVEDTLLAFQQLAKDYRDLLDIPVIAITGSNGKTTTKDILRDVLQTKYQVYATEGNFNNHIGVPLTILRTKPSHEVLILEMGMNHAGEIDLLGHIGSPDYAVITNIGESHIEHLGSRHGIAEAKGELLAHLRPNGTALLPYDREFHTQLAQKTKESVVFFGSTPLQNIPLSTGRGGGGGVTRHYPMVCAYSIGTDGTGTSFRALGCGDDATYWMPLFGEHNITNAVPAIYIAREMGFTEEEIRTAFKQVQVSSMRFERVEGKGGALLVNDAYNASPTSMKKSISTFLESFPSKRCILVLGDMYELGEDSDSLHMEVGEHICSLRGSVEFVVTVGEASRFISSRVGERFRHFSDVEEASAFLQLFLEGDFAFLFKASRGMRLERLVRACALPKREPI